MKQITLDGNKSSFLIEMKREEFGNRGKYVSKKRFWKIDKKNNCQGVHIDFKKKTIFFNEKENWVRFETENIIHIYPYKKEDP